MDEGSHNPKNEDLLRLIYNIVVCKTTATVVIFDVAPWVTAMEFKHFKYLITNYLTT